MKNRKIIIKYCMLIVFVCVGYNIAFASAPTFDDNFAKYMISDTPDKNGRVESVFNLSNCIKRDQTIEQNIKNLFYPSTTNTDSACIVTWTGGLLWDFIKFITFGLIFLFVVLTGVKFLTEGADGGKKAASNLMYIAYGSFLVFGAIWILGYVLNIENLKWSSDLVNNLENNLFLQILSFFKVLAFFIAVVMMVWTWFKMMSALDKEDKVKEGKKWIVNIIVALVLIKIVDYIYYMAQSVTFASQASAMIISIAKILWWALGIVFVLGLLYSGYSMFLSNGDEKAFKKVKSILMNIFLVSLIIFFFLLIIYQIFNEFVK